MGGMFQIRSIKSFRVMCKLFYFSQLRLTCFELPLQLGIVLLVYFFDEKYDFGKERALAGQ